MKATEYFFIYYNDRLVSYSSYSIWARRVDTSAAVVKLSMHRGKGRFQIDSHPNRQICSNIQKLNFFFSTKTICLDLICIKDGVGDSRDKNKTHDSYCQIVITLQNHK